MKRVLSLVLALMMLCAAFALTACGQQTTTPPFGDIGTGGGTEGSTIPPEAPNPDDEEAANKPRPGFEDVDFAGHTFLFVSPLGTTDGWADYEVYAEEDGAGILDAAINARNNAMAEHYDCLIAVEDIDAGKLEDDRNTNQCRVDIALTRYNLGGKADGKYYDFHSLGIDLTQPWWDQNFINDVTINGQLYTMLGAYSLTSFDATWVMFFNKDVKENNDQLKNIDFYELVYNNEWTLDKFYELIKMAKVEDGNQAMELGTTDIFGLVSSDFGIRGLYFGAGQSYLNKTDAADGSTTFTAAFNQSAVDATDIIVEIYADEAVKVTGYQTVGKQFRSATTLFAPEVLRYAAAYAGKQGASTEAINIGIIPHPKLNAEQEGYKHNIDNHMIYLMIPTTCQDLARITDFVELYAYHSYLTVYKEYLNLYKYQYTTDTDSATMVDEILKSRYFDLAYHFNFASVDSEFATGVQDGKNLVAELGGKFGDAIVSAANTWRDKLPKNN